MDLQRPIWTITRSTRSVLLPLVLPWLALTAVAGVFIWTIYRIELVGMRAMLLAGERHTLQIASLGVAREIARAGADLLYLSEDDQLQEWLMGRRPGSRDLLTDDYHFFLNTHPFYERLRLADEAGSELLHLPRDVSPDRKGQDRNPELAKTDQRTSHSLAQGTLHINPEVTDDGSKSESASHLGLALRLTTPIFDRLGAQGGILSLDYAVRPLLDGVMRASHERIDAVWLVNLEQRWLLGRGKAVMDGVTALDQGGDTAAAEVAVARSLLVSGDEQEYFMEEGMFYTYARLTPTMLAESSADLQLPDGWLLLARISPALMAVHAHRLQRNMLVIFGLTAFILAGVVALVSYHVLRRLQAEREVRDSETMLRGLLESAPDAIVVTDRGGRIMLVNAQAKRFFGYSRKEMEGSPVGMLIPDHLRDKYLASLAAFPEDAERRPPGAGFDLYGLHKDGSEFPVSVSLNAVQTGSGPLVIADIRDVAAKRRDERAIRELNLSLKQRNAELVNVNRELESFSYSVSHDLCAPLRSIDGFSSMLIVDYADRLDDRGRDRLERIRASSHHMRALVDDLLKLSMVSRADLNRAEVDLSAIVRDVDNDLRRQHPQRQVGFNVQPDVIVHGDARLLRIVIFNLLENAWKFTAKQQEPKIEFGSFVREGVRVCYVGDNGAGFDGSLSDKLFGAFQRLHAQDDFPGTGIGLATVQRIIHRHGGRIWAEGETGRGARFLFILNEGDAP